MGDLAPCEADDAPAEHREVLVAAAVVLEGVARRVGIAAVDFDDEVVGGPEEVGFGAGSVGEGDPLVDGVGRVADVAADLQERFRARSTSRDLPLSAMSSSVRASVVQGTSSMTVTSAAMSVAELWVRIPGSVRPRAPRAVTSTSRRVPSPSSSSTPAA